MHLHRFGATIKPLEARAGQTQRRAMATSEMKKVFVDFDAEPAPTTPEAFSTMVKNEIAKWSEVVKNANIKPE